MSESETDVGTGNAADELPEHVEFVRFQLGGASYAVELGAVAQLVRNPELTRVPRTPPLVAGVTGVAGDVTAVVEGRVLVEAPARDPAADTALLLFDRQATGQTSGLLVDVVDRVATLPVDRIRPPADGELPETDRRLVKAVFESESGTTRVIDPERVVAVASEELQLVNN
jgi:purine-binding chemotaxis protein CheW